METSHQPSGALLHIIARAAPPHERANSLWFAPVLDQDERRVRERADAWIKAIAGDEPGQFDAILSACGRDRDTLLRGLVDVVVSDPQQLPQWASVLVQLMSNDAPRASSDLFAPFIHHGRQALARFDPAGSLTSEEAIEQMLDQLRSRLLTVTSQVLHYELLATAAPWFGQQSVAPAWTSLDGTITGWLRRFDRYPALAYVVAVTYLNWHTGIAELIERVQTDQALLATRLFDGAAPGKIVSFKGDAGDMHDHGRSVVLLTFAHGGRVVYKPKDLRVAAAYMDLVEQLNADLALPLATRAVLTRGDYAWEEFVTPIECQSEAAVERFYRRMGMTIRLLQLLEARDFWLDNLIACGDQPVFIDLEMLLQPQDCVAEPQTAAERAVQRRLEESVVKMGVVAMPTLIGIGISAEDLGALNSQQRFLTPFKAIPSQTNSLSQASATSYRAWEHTEHVPHLQGTPIDSACYIDQVHAGYREMQACLLAQRERLRAADSPLLAMERVPVRFIHRDTWSCYQLIQWSMTPGRLTDGVRREQFLAQFLQLAYQQYGANPQALQLAASEIAAVREGDVPFSQCLPCDRAVLTVDGGAIANYFDETAAERLHTRLAQLDSFDIDEQLALLDTCFSTGLHQPVAHAPRKAHTPSQPTQSWLALAVELGDFVLAQASGSNDDLAWIGRTYHPFSAMAVVERLHPDLLTGSCGLAMLFADLYAASGLARFHDAALGALRATQRVIATATATRVRQELAGGAVPAICGALYGSGAQIYALRRCARALDMPALAAMATRYLHMLCSDELYKTAGHDVVSGTAGLLLATLAGDTREPLCAATIALAEHLLRCRTHDGTLADSAYPAQVRLPAVPDATAGLALALLRMAQRPGAAEHLRDAAGQMAALVCERDLATPTRLLARLGLAAAGYRDDATLFEATDRYFQADLAQCTSAELLNSLEIALAADALGQERRYGDTAADLGRALWQRHQQHGSWFPETFTADRHNLSALTGVAAIAHAFLRVHNPQQVASLRLVA